MKRRRTNKGKKFPPEVLTTDEAIALLNAASTASSTGIRNRALLAVLWRAGLRVNECLALYLKDVDLDLGSIAVLHGKGDKARTVGIDAAAVDLLRLWIERRDRLGFGRLDRLFCTLKGNPIKSQYLRALLPRLATKAGITKRVHPHGLRHTMTAELAREGVPIHEIRDQLGHSNVATTDRYLKKVAPEALRKKMNARKWGDNKHDEPNR